MEETKGNDSGAPAAGMRLILLFALIVYGPAWLGLLWCLWQLLGGGSASGAVQIVGLFALSLPIVWVAFHGVRRFGFGHAAFWVLFLSWQVYGFILGFVFASALAGTSMAVVDGAASRSDLLEQKLLFALVMLLPEQLFIFPWVIWVRRLLRLYLAEMVVQRENGAI